MVPIYDFGEVDGRLSVTMRLIEGQDLQTLLAQGPLEPPRTVWIIEQIASALHAAHRVELVHRDVKPSNILVAEDDFAYLIDFGIARAAGETGLTNTGATIGTWEYMAPERFTDGHADARADVYSLTCVLHQCLTGELPFQGGSLEQIAAAHMFKAPPEPATIRADVPRAMNQVVATGMAKKPDARYPTTKELARSAREALTTPTQSPPAPPTVSATNTHAAPWQAGHPSGRVSGSGGLPTPTSAQTPHYAALNYAPTRLGLQHNDQKSASPVGGPQSQGLSRGAKISLGALVLLIIAVLSFAAAVVGLSARDSASSTAVSSSTAPASSQSATPTHVPTSAPQLSPVPSADNVNNAALMSALSRGYSSSNCSSQAISEVQDAFPTVLAVQACGPSAEMNGPAAAKYFLFPNAADTDSSFTKLIGTDKLVNCGSESFADIVAPGQLRRHGRPGGMRDRQGPRRGHLDQHRQERVGLRARIQQRHRGALPVVGERGLK